MNRTMASLLALMAIAGAPLLAQADPPSRVARLNLVNGSVSFRPGSVEDWTAATLNYPLTSGDHLWSDVNSRTEMHIGATAIRMGSETALAFLNLDDRTVQLSLTQGSLIVRLRQLGDAENFEVDTPNVAVTLLRAGDYRVDADANNGITTVTVRGGDAQVTGGGAAFSVRPRESARITGAETVAQEIGPMLPPDEFDSWCNARDMREDRLVQSAHYVPREMIGYEDLEENGVWVNEPGYGWVWRPTAVAAGWAPYRYGHWAWVEPWGWTWIDDAPWGFAPFHYGRWAMAGGGWVWVPGAMVAGVRPVYAPALVAFVGGPRFGVAVGMAGGVAMAAWFPLGPREPYIPAYHVSEVYVRQVNIMHVTNVTVINSNVRYVNQGVPGAVTVVSRETFVGARPVHSGIVAVDTRVVTTAPVVAVAPIAPSRVSVMAHVGPAVAVPPTRIVERTVVVRNAPPPPPVAFAARERALAANPGRPLEAAQAERFRATAPVRPTSFRQVGAPERPEMAPRNDRPSPGGFNHPGGAPVATPERPMNNAGPARNDRPAYPGSNRPATAPAATPERPMNNAAPVRNDRPAYPGSNRPATAPAATPERPVNNAAPVRNEHPAAVPAQRNDRPAAAQEQRREASQERRDERKANNREKGEEKRERREEKQEERKQ